MSSFAPKASSNHLSMERDPVCGMSVDPLRAAAQAEHADKNYFFCGKGCAEKFRADPEAMLARDRDRQAAKTAASASASATALTPTLEHAAPPLIRTNTSAAQQAATTYT